ncbi:MAG TPA: TorF family putative porin [Stenotrophomonas sp.]|nr:TorF family putative porin [Stenotrophomonas sp.]
MHACFPSACRRQLARAALLLCLPAFAPLAAASTLSGNATLSSDYVWRGTTQTQGDFAAQAGLKWAADNGLYASAWGSNVDFGAQAGASSELDLVLGWSGALSSDWAVDANLTHYRYPGSHAELDWTELNGTLTWKQNYWLQLGWSNDALASDAHGTYAQLGARLPLGARLRAEAALGHYWLDDAYGDSYSHGQLGLVWAVRAPLELRVTVHDTDHAAERLFPGLAGSRVEAALQASF